MREVKGKIFVTEHEILACTTINVKKLLNEIDDFVYVHGVTDVLMFEDERELKSEIPVFMPRDYHHLLKGFIKRNGRLTGKRMISFLSVPEHLENTIGFYLTEYLEVNGVKNNVAEVFYERAKDYIEKDEMPETIGFAFSDHSEFESVAESGGMVADEVGEFYKLPIIEYYILDDVNKLLERYGLNNITECIISNDKDQTRYPPDTEETSSETLAPQSDVFRLLKGIVHVCYGDEILSELKQPKSKRISEISADLELKGYKFDPKTLRKYLKNLPD
ncbi:MAG: hypothetical protein ABW152_00230 [Candidatus Thiodiazotropha endolucinida]